VPTPDPTPEPTPKPTPKPTPRPTSARYALLDPCPDRDRCWIYTVRSGDNLYSIANYFGVALQTVYDWNPWTQTTRLRAGQQLRMPPPTR
jgi:Tfp pilus assembly protein FimV